MSNLPVPAAGKFYDLNMPYNNVNSARKRLAMLVELGYEVVAWNTYFESTITNTKSKKKKIVIPEPPAKLKIDDELLATLTSHNKTLIQLNRLTIELADIEDLHKVRDALSQGAYDIIAVLPRNEKLFHSACTELNIELVCIDGSEKLGYVPRYNVVKAAITRGIHFEICYSPMVKDNTVRRLTIANAQRLVEFSQGKNVVLSSGAVNPMELRGPYDVANLNTLFGVKENLIIHTVSKNCRAAVVHGFGRKTAKYAIFVQKLPRSTQDESEEKPNERTIDDVAHNQVVADDVADDTLSEPIKSSRANKRKGKKIKATITNDNNDQSSTFDASADSKDQSPKKKSRRS